MTAPRPASWCLAPSVDAKTGPMTVYIAHAAADRAFAEALEGVLERRGHFVELDDGEEALPPIAPSDALVGLVSSAFGASAARLRLTQRALDAWSENRLTLVKLDETSPPIGLRDVPAIEARVADTRDLVWVDVATAIQNQLGAAAPRLAPQHKKPRCGFASAVLRVLLNLLLLAPGVFATAVTASVFLANRIGPRPGGLGELRSRIDAFGEFYGLASGVTEWLFVAAFVLMGAVLGRLGASLFRKPTPAAPSAAKTDKPGSGVFAIVAAADAARVRALIQAASSHSGQAIRLGEPGSDNSASIRAAAGVLVMCSAAAFDSDQVKRDLFLAERKGKRVIPVFLDAVIAAEDFAYFFGSAPVDVHNLDEPARARAVASALSGV